MGRACEKQASRVNIQSGHGGRLRQSITRTASRKSPDKKDTRVASGMREILPVRPNYDTQIRRMGIAGAERTVRHSSGISSIADPISVL